MAVVVSEAWFSVGCLFVALTAQVRAADGERGPQFEAGDISIGEPLPLPLQSPPAADAAAAASGGTNATAPGPSIVPPSAELPALPAAPPPIAGRFAPATTDGGPGTGWLGVVIAESATPGRLAVVEVSPDGPAAAGGLRIGDEVRAIDGLPLQTSDDAAQALTAIAAGQRVRLAVARGGQISDVTLEALPRPTATRGWGAAVAAPPEAPVTPAAAAPAPSFVAPSSTVPPAVQPSSPPAFATQPVPEPAGGAAPERIAAPVAAAVVADGPKGRTALGVRTLPIDPALQARFRLPEASGAYVISVVGDLPASRAGVPPGSVIVALDERPVRSPDDLTRLVTAGPVGRPVPLEFVLPGGTPRRAEVVLQALEQPLEAALLGTAGPQPTAVPTLAPGPPATTVRRPPQTLDDQTAAALLDEVRRLRTRLESLERRLEAGGR